MMKVLPSNFSFTSAVTCKVRCLLLATNYGHRLTTHYQNWVSIMQSRSLSKARRNCTFIDKTNSIFFTVTVKFIKHCDNILSVSVCKKKTVSCYRQKHFSRRITSMKHVFRTGKKSLPTLMCRNEIRFLCVENFLGWFRVESHRNP